MITPKADHVRPGTRAWCGICAGGEEQSSSLPRPSSSLRRRPIADSGRYTAWTRRHHRPSSPPWLRLREPDPACASRCARGSAFGRSPTQARYLKASHLPVSLGGDPRGFVDMTLRVLVASVTE